MYFRKQAIWTSESLFAVWKVLFSKLHRDQQSIKAGRGDLEITAVALLYSECV